MIEYLAPSGGGGNLPYSNLQQLRLDLSTADFTKLNSSPITIYTPNANEYFCPLNVTIDFNNTQWLGGLSINLAFESLFGANPSNVIQQYINLWANQRGVFTMNGLGFQYYGGENTTDSSSLVLTASADSLITFNKFIIQITYFIYTP